MKPRGRTGERVSRDRSGLAGLPAFVNGLGVGGSSRAAEERAASRRAAVGGT